MSRRNFLKNGFALGVASLIGGATSKEVSQSRQRTLKTLEEHRFKLNYAPTFGTFEAHAGNDLGDQLKFMAEMGFRGLTDDGMRNRDRETQERIGRQMTSLGLEMGVIGAHTYHWQEPDLASGDVARREEFLNEIRSSVDVAKRVNAKWMTVMPGHRAGGLEMGYQTANVVEALRKACEILEPHGLVMVVEPVNHNYPGLFLTTIDQAYSLCKAVDSPSCKILFDLYHQQINGGNLIPNIHRAWEEIGIFQVADNPGRKEPFTGEINYSNVFSVIHEKGYDGLIGMEHGKSISGKEGERAVIDAYVRADKF